MIDACAPDQLTPQTIHSDQFVENLSVIMGKIRLQRLVSATRSFPSAEHYMHCPQSTQVSDKTRLSTYSPVPQLSKLSFALKFTSSQNVLVPVVFRV